MAATEQEKSKLRKLVELGERAHLMSRSGELNNPELNDISQQIIDLDKVINAPLGQKAPSRADGKCPSCGADYGDASFCGSCGQNIIEFFSKPIPSCPVCGFRVGEDDKYCGVCGVKREG